MKEGFLLAFFVLVALALSGCTSPPPAPEMDCQTYCAKQPHVQCVGQWNVSGSFPNCECEFVCEQQKCVDEGQAVPVIANPPECCEGLTLISPMAQGTVGISGFCTAKCGDGACGEIESSYNCPKDCTAGDQVYSREYIENKIEEANYCETPEDCVLAQQKCPFGCYVLVNSEEVERINSLISAYKATCTQTCTDLEEKDCVEGKCEEIFYGKFA